MSAKSSNKLHGHHIQHKSDAARHVIAKTLDQSDLSLKNKRKWAMLLWLPLWVAISFIAAQLIVAAIVWLCDVLQIPMSGIASPAIVETIVASLVYICTLAIVIGVPYVVYKRETNLEVIGLQRLPSWADIALSPLGFIVYALLWSALSSLVIWIIPHFPIDQAQNVGFHALGHRYEYTLAFITLVVIAPLAEEVLFRGYLYGKLQNSVSVIPALLVTSLLFGSAHLLGGGDLQWNVAIDTFSLSVILCTLRSITGSIWAGVLLHMLKNAVAFYAVFVAPMLLMGG